MSILSSVLCSELVSVCNRMSDRWSWTRLCCKCDRIHARYGTEEIPTDIDDPLELFDATDVSKNVMRFVVLSWGENVTLIHSKSICLSKNFRFDLWKDCVYKLWRLQRERSHFLRLSSWRDTVIPSNQVVWVAWLDLPRRTTSRANASERSWNEIWGTLA